MMKPATGFWLQFAALRLAMRAVPKQIELLRRNSAD
jgi:hypothetical protein